MILVDGYFSVFEAIENQVFIAQWNWRGKKKSIMNLFVYLPSYISISLCFISLCRHKGADPSVSSWHSSMKQLCQLLPVGDCHWVYSCLYCSCCNYYYYVISWHVKEKDEWVFGGLCLSAAGHLLMQTTESNWEVSTVRNELFGTLIFNLVRRQSDFLMKPNKLRVCQFLQKGKAFFNVLD